jgi:Phage capsid family
LRQSLALPRQNSTATVSWLAENTAATRSNLTLDNVTASPKRAVAVQAFSTALVKGSLLPIQAKVNGDLFGVVAQAIDQAALIGRGVTTYNEPLGLFNMPTGSGYQTVNSVTFGGAATWPSILSMENAVENQNVYDGTFATITSPAVKTKWKNAPKTPTQNVNGFLWENSGDIVNGSPAFATTKLSATNRVVFGKMSELHVLLWNAIDLVVDPFTLASAAQVVVTVTALVDVIALHSNAFCVSSDAGTSSRNERRTRQSRPRDSRVDCARVVGRSTRTDFKGQ